MLGHAEEVLKLTFGLSLGVGKALALADEGLDTCLGDVGQHVDVDGLRVAQVCEGLQGNL